MGPVLKSLVELQDIEYKVRGTKAKLDKKRKAILRQEHIIKQNQSAYDAKHEEMKLSQVQFDAVDLDKKSKEAEIAKLRGALNAARTNKEYSAVLTQINNYKADALRFDDQELRLMTSMEEDQTAIKTITDTIDVAKERLKESTDEYNKVEDEISSELSNLEAKRKDSLEQVPPAERDNFVKLSGKYDGEVLSEVIKTSRKKEQTCGGCYMRIPLEVLNSLLSGKDEVKYCPSCGRIFVLAPDAAKA